MTKILAIALMALLTSCATTGETINAATAGDNILLATPGEKWQLAETDESGKAIRTLSLSLTDHPADTCIAGDWKQVRVLSDPSRYTRKPAYLLTEGRLEILLINELCDAYDSYIFDQNTVPGLGSHQAYGLSGGKSLGRVMARKAQ